jgi:MOSC domain-containing protein YiiM
VARLLSVNLGRPRPNPHKSSVESTGIGKAPAAGPVQVRDPGPKLTGLGSGLVGDYIGDGKHHGGHDQAVYAFQREDLDRWEERLGRKLPNGFFGENLTTSGIDVNGALVGERWRIGPDVELAVTSPRIPCATFRGWVGEKGWLKMFTADGRCGAYLRVIKPGEIRAGDEIRVINRPDHDVSVTVFFRASMDQPELLPRLLVLGDDLDPGTRVTVERYLTRTGQW